MKYVLCLVLCLAATDAFAFGRWGRRYSTDRSAESQSSPVDKAPVYDVEKALVERINAERRRYGLVPLILDAMIHPFARRHCGWMANSGRMVHSADPVAENIAMGQSDVETAVNTWMNSSGHRANILNPGYRFTGVAAYESPSGTIFWCQNFR